MEIKYFMASCNIYAFPSQGVTVNTLRNAVIHDEIRLGRQMYFVFVFFFFFNRNPWYIHRVSFAPLSSYLTLIFLVKIFFKLSSIKSTGSCGAVHNAIRYTEIHLRQLFRHRPGCVLNFSFKHFACPKAIFFIRLSWRFYWASGSPLKPARGKIGCFIVFKNGTIR